MACEPGARNRSGAGSRNQVWDMPASDPAGDSGTRILQYARQDAIELSLSRGDLANKPTKEARTLGGRLPSGNPAAGLKVEEAPTLHAATKGFNF